MKAIKTYIGKVAGKYGRKSQVVTIAVSLLAVIGYFYVSGLLAQFLYLVREFMSAGPFAENNTLRFSEMKFGFGAFGFLATDAGGRGLILTAAIIIVVIILVKYRDKIFNVGGDYDERGFRKVHDGVYGTADWMSKNEAKKVLEVGSPESVEGTILGEMDGQVYCLKADSKKQRSPFNGHVFVSGASGTGKSRAIVRNYIMQAVRRGESVAVTDPKGEIFADTYQYLRKNGYNVKVFDLVDPDKSDRWNPMADIGDDTLLAQMLTNIIIGNTGNGKGDRFWDNGEANLLKALTLYVQLSKEFPEEEKTLGTVYKMLTDKSIKQLDDMFSELKPDNPAKGPYGLFSQGNDNVKTSIITGLGTRLQVMQNEAVCRLVGANDIDLTELGREKTAFFIILSDQDTTMKFLSSLFFSLLFIKLTRYADAQEDRRCPVPVNLVLDEFNNVGRLGGAEDGSDFARTLSVVRSRAIHVMICVQSLGQLQNRYANNLWAEIVGNCDTWVLLGCTDDLTAKYFSQRAGEMSIQVNSSRRKRHTFSLFEVVPEYTENIGYGKRLLLTPDEVLRMEPGEELVVLRGYNVLKLRKFDYSKHPESRKLVPMSIGDYVPVERQMEEAAYAAEAREVAAEAAKEVEAEAKKAEAKAEVETAPVSETQTEETPPSAVEEKEPSFTEKVADYASEQEYRVDPSTGEVLTKKRITLEDDNLEDEDVSLEDSEHAIDENEDLFSY